MSKSSQTSDRFIAIGGFFDDVPSGRLVDELPEPALKRPILAIDNGEPLLIGSAVHLFAFWRFVFLQTFSPLLQ